MSGTLVGWISIGTQLKMAHKQIRFPQKAVSVEGCNANWIVEYLTLSSSDVVQTPEPPFVFYRLSYMYYTMLGAVTAVIVGVIVSSVTGGNKHKLNRDLFSPVIHPFLKVKGEGEEMKGANGSTQMKDIS